MHLSAAALSLLNTRFLQGAVSAWQDCVKPVLSSAIDCKNKTLNRG